MLIRSRMGMSADGFVATREGIPAFLTMPDFVPVGGLDRLELVVLPIVLGDGVRLTPSASPQYPLELVGAPRTYEDGSVELIYRPGSDNGGQS